MLSINTQAARTCQGLSRRELLQAGGLGALGLSLPRLLQGRAIAQASPARRAPHFGQAKSCLIIFLSGGASHHDTFDMKPAAPAEIRG